jgi:hypothetical protein
VRNPMGNATVAGYWLGGSLSANDSAPPARLEQFIVAGPTATAGFVWLLNRINFLDLLATI